jgi:hypothetical protein
MAKPETRISAVPEGAQAAVARAIETLAERLGLEPAAIAVTRIDFLDPDSTGGGAHGIELFEDARPSYRIFLLAKGVQYVFRTVGQRLTLEEERFVV